MWLYHLNVAVCQITRPYWRLGLVGDRASIPRSGPLLIAANHQSFLDPWFLAFCFPRPIRYLMTAKWYYRSPAWNFFFRAWGTEPVRDGDSRGTINAVCDILRRGEVSGIFPEGGISRDGRIQRFRPGLARMAALSGAPVLPVGIRGSFRAFPRGAKFPKPKTVKVHVGEPMRFPGAPYTKPPPRDLSVPFTRDVYRAVCHLAGQDERALLIDEPASSAS